MNKYFVLILTVLLTEYWYLSNEFSLEKLFIYLLVLILSLVLFFLKKERFVFLKHNYLRHSIFFLFSYLIVHFQRYFDLLLGKLSEDNPLFVDENVICKSALLSLIGLVSFFIGYILKNKTLKASKIDNLSFSIHNLTFYLEFFSIFLLCIYYYFSRAYINGGYGYVKTSSLTLYIELILHYCYITIMIISARKSIKSSYRIKSLKSYLKLYSYNFYFSIFVYFLFVIMSGDRGPIIYLSIPFFSLYFLVNKVNLKFKYFLFYLILGALFITTLGISRGYRNNEVNVLKRIESSFLNNDYQNGTSFIPFTEELSNSVNCMHYAVSYVPSSHSYMYGLFTFNSLFTYIPFSFSFYSPPKKYAVGSSFITWIGHGDYSKSGLGTTCVADLYLDFGVLGVVVGMFFFGLLIRWCEVNLYKCSFLDWRFFMSLYVFSYCISIPRASIILSLRNPFWLLLFWFLIKKIYGINRAK